MKNSRRVFLVIAAAALAATARAAEGVTVTVSKIKDLNLRIYGFVETDMITDNTQGFTEEQGNNLVPMRTAATTVPGVPPPAADNFPGKHQRTQFSVRNSRLGFDLTVPKTDSGLETEAVIELDFLGNNAPDTKPAAGTGAPSPGAPVQSEASYWNNPAVRVRHAYANLTYEAWNAKVGQYWSLLGWQPYYFPGEAIVQPGPGQLYRRFAQARITRTDKLMDTWTLESAADAARPPEMNSGVPEFHGGLRLASTECKAASIGGAGTSMVGLSAALSAALLPVRTDNGNLNGGAVAVDMAVPIIPSKDGKDRTNNLVVMGEFADGKGVGNVEYSGLTLGVPAVTAGTLGPTGIPNGTAIDQGIAAMNIQGNVELIHYRTFRTHAQYSLNNRWATSFGYAQVEGRNLSHFTDSTTAGKIAATKAYVIAPKIQFGYVSVMYDPLTWLRLAAEWNHTVDVYNDPGNRNAINNRFQLSTYFVF